MGTGPLSMITARIKGGMLSLVLVISLIMVIISASLISLAYYFRVLNLTLDIKDKLGRNALSGAQYLLSQQVRFPAETVTLDLFGDGNDSVKLSVQPWGAYQIGCSEAFSRRRSVALCFIVGSRPASIGQSALYLADDNKPLQIAGNTIVNGPAYLPKAGVKKAYIRSKPYRASQLIFGEVLESNAELPALEPAILAYLSSVIFSAAPGSDSLANSEAIAHSFLQAEPLRIYSEEPLVLASTLQGKVMVRSDKSIFVDASAQLENVILIAPKIVIEHDFKGILQAFATDTLVVEHHAALGFPSVMALAGSANAYMEIQAGVSIEGALLSFSLKNEPSGSVKINEEAIVSGQVYVNGALQLLGDVKGNVMCRKLVSELPSGILENHLIDVTIDHDLILKTDFLGIPIGLENNGAGILKWLK
jgi:cytoskeletal protein CcmA (bactofilin family)